MRTEPTVGRPRKYGNEETETLSFRVPASLWAYLAKRRPSPGEAAFEVLSFERDLTLRLSDLLADLRVSAALNGQSYDLDRAETLARLVRLGLQAERREKKR